MITQRSFLHLIFVFVVSLGLCGCGQPPEGDSYHNHATNGSSPNNVSSDDFENDANNEPSNSDETPVVDDTPPAQDDVENNTAQPDPIADDSPFPESSLPTSCDASCSEHTLVGTFDTGTFAFPEVVFGLTAPEYSAQNSWELYVESWQGGFSGCPTRDDVPTPDYTLVIGGISFPADDTVQATGDGLAVTLLDYSGELLPDALAKPSHNATLTPVAMRLCMDCPVDDPAFIAFDLRATFDEGIIEGRIYATHCAAMDEL